MSTSRGLLRRAAIRAGRLAGFAGYLGYQLVRSNLEVAWEVLTPGSRLRPGIVALPLRSRTTMEIASIANLIGLTPGTLTVAVRRDPPRLYVHGMHAGEPEPFRHRLRRLEERMLLALRPVEPAGSPSQPPEPTDRRQP